ncbi:MAG: 4-alpha-glucanotransferase [Opitutales bacterium]|nr:4-alpha-glucanotransferase [Opitutales bacterium]
MADYSWQTARAAGVLMHISSLPSDQGIGSFGNGAERFLDFLNLAGVKYWQICPLSPTGFGDSPYQSFSAFAGNPYFIDFFELKSLGLITEDDAQKLRALPQNRCDYGAIYQTLPQILGRAAKAFFETGKPKIFQKSFGEFCEEQKDWLESYALFRALKKRFGGGSWTEWPEDFKSSKNIKLTAGDIEAANAVKFGQYVFFSQYLRLKEKANARGIEIIGDMPIFVSADSADVWANPQIFDLNEDLTPRNVAGVGPDYFSPSGQLWGNPLYAWKTQKSEVFAFWEKRLKKAFELYDVLRLDHFRGFADYWAIPSGSADATKGEWIVGPGKDFFDKMRKIFPAEKFIAEDLGILSERAKKLCADINIPTMAVLQFAFGGDAKNPYLPHNLRRNIVCYTGTHDNETTNAWYAGADAKTQDHFRRYFATPAHSPNWNMILGAFTSVANLAIIPMQDILSLDGEARMNTPGVAAGNWQWRIGRGALDAAIENTAPFLRGLCEISGRETPLEMKQIPQNLLKFLSEK